MQPYQWLVVALGALVCVLAIAQQPVERIDIRFLLLASLTVISSRFAIKIPRFDTNVTIADTFIFLAIYLHGGPAGILLAAAEGLSSGARVGKKLRTILFNSAAMACATFVTVQLLEAIFGATTNIPRQDWSLLLIAVCVSALVQFFTNTWLVAVGMACKHGLPLWQMWTRNYVWSSVTYIAGAVAASMIAYSVGTMGFYALLVAIPLIWVLYYTYHKYLDDIRTTAAQAEQAEHDRAEAERARAEAERARAEQAERHIEELNRHLAEQERIGRELEESREHFRHVAFHDTLTNLPNRALLINHLKLAIERAKLHPDHIYALLFLDLDRFKYINDSLGHVAGDQLLISIARRLEKCLRPTDMVARLGGDEFAILLDGVTGHAEASLVAERAQRELMRPVNLYGHEVYTTASIGITLSSIGYDHPENILRDADTAMYHAKEKGKACFELFDATMHAHAVARLQLESDMRRALEREEFRVHYQPIVALEINRVVGFEALVRWEHPQRGCISPVEFISIAEETGLIVDLGSWVLRQACRQTHAWQLQYPEQKALSISVNLSARQFAQPDLLEQIKQILKETELDPRFLKLEITESVVMDNAEIASTMLMQLRALGVQLSIDDFGTGYSSLSYLHRFPVNILKIDRSFVTRIGGDDENTEIIRTILTLAGNLGMDVIAEGVETEQQLEKLKAMRCEYGQGYLFSRPLDAEAASSLLLEYQQRAGLLDLEQIKHHGDAELLDSTLIM
ncbi:MAG TPA: EAL domain-containing protein [Pyrinomonadaceae bacterium]|jgi:diguanylate cyclase (GGDEF)-like protein